MSQTVIGVFATNPQAQQAVSQLQSAGYSSAHIDVSSRANYNDTTLRTQRDESIGGFFSSLFSDDDDNTRNNYTEAARRGTVVTVHTDDMARAERAADILDANGAIDANDASTKLRAKGIAATDADTTLEVIKEDLMVGKREITTGGVRMQSRIVAKPVSEDIRLREEQIHVTRTPVDRPATAADFDTFKEGTVTMTETAEIPVVQKTARVVEEVSLGKTASTHTETITETVRETEVDIERVAGETVAGVTNTVAGAASGAWATASNAVDAAGNAIENTGDSIHNALDRDNDGELVDLNDNDGRIG